MFKNIVDKIREISGPLSCPECREEVSPQRVGDGELYECPSCDYKGTADEWYNSVDKALQWRNPDQEPEGNWIKKQVEEDMVTWAIPAKRRFNFLIGFGLLWCGFMVLFTFVMFFGDATSDCRSCDDVSEDGAGAIGGFILFILFMGLFWSIGIGMLVAGFIQTLSQHLLMLTNGQLVYVRSVLNKKKKKSFAVKDIVSVDLVSFYSRNYQPVYGVKISMAQKSLKFGSTLRMEDKSWLVSDLRRYMIPTATEDEALTEREEPPERNQGEFKVTFPPAKNMWAGLLIGFTFGTAGVGTWYWVHFLPGNNFKGIDYAVTFFCLMFSVVGYGVMITSLRNNGYETVVEGTRSSVTVYSHKNGLKKHKHQLKREAITEVRVVNNSKETDHDVSAYLYTDSEAYQIVKWRTMEEVTAGVEELKKYLG